MSKGLAATEELLHKAAHYARSIGQSNLEFTWQDLGDYYHVYGTSATGRGFIRFLMGRAERRVKR